MSIVAWMYSSRATRRRPPSGMRARETRLLAGPSAALRTGWRPSGPLQKVSADPSFNRTSFPPLFPTLRTRRSGGRAEAPRTWCRSARAPRSGADRHAPNLYCKKRRHTPIFTLPVLPHLQFTHTPRAGVPPPREQALSGRAAVGWRTAPPTPRGRKAGTGSG